MNALFSPAFKNAQPSARTVLPQAVLSQIGFPQIALGAIAALLTWSSATPISQAQSTQNAQNVPEIPAFPSSPVRSTARSDVSLLKSGDQIDVTVLGFPELSGQQRVTASGTVQIPLVGNILLNGLTPQQATARVTTALLPYVRRPQVSVTLLSISPPRISITGAVRRPGPHLVVPPDLPEGDFSDLTDGDFQTLSYALILAGGVTPEANLRNITIRRPVNPNVPGVGGRTAVSEVEVDLWRVIQQGDLGADLRIYDGDEIVVPVAALSSDEQQALLSSTVAPTSIAVQVAGEVRSPGTVQVGPTSDLMTALAAAGGPTNEARSSIDLFRIGPEGRLNQQSFEFGDTTEPLRDGDVIVVEQRRSVGVLNFLSLLFGPLGDFVDTLRLF
ncbi:MAG: polysaccharide biosynthesis/export family protein [Cyanobacteria bacterium J06598_1]